MSLSHHLLPSIKTRVLKPFLCEALGALRLNFSSYNFQCIWVFFFAPKTWVGEGGPENKCKFLTAIYDF
jgi:hypothetical protein